MHNLLSKVFPAKKDLTEKFERLQEKVDHMGLSEGEANIEMAKILSKEVTESMGEASPECFTVWLKHKDSETTILVGYCSSEKDINLKKEIEEGKTARHKVLGIRRPVLINEEKEVKDLIKEIIADENKIPENWISAALSPVEKAGEALGLAVAFFTRKLEEEDLEGMIRLSDLLGSYIFTGEEGFPVLPQNLS